MKIKKGDKVVVISGVDKGKEGKAKRISKRGRGMKPPFCVILIQTPVFERP